MSTQVMKIISEDEVTITPIVQFTLPPPQLESCIICLQNGLESDLVRPCKCQNPIHKSCLIKWISMKAEFGRQYLICEVCMEKYNIQVQALRTGLVTCLRNTSNTQIITALTRILVLIAAKMMAIFFLTNLLMMLISHKNDYHMIPCVLSTVILIFCIIYIYKDSFEIYEDYKKWRIVCSNPSLQTPLITV